MRCRILRRLIWVCTVCSCLSIWIHTVNMVLSFRHPLDRRFHLAFYSKWKCFVLIDHILSGTIFCYKQEQHWDYFPALALALVLSLSASIVLSPCIFLWFSNTKASRLTKVYTHIHCAAPCLLPLTLLTLTYFSCLAKQLVFAFRSVSWTPPAVVTAIQWISCLFHFFALFSNIYCKIDFMAKNRSDLCNFSSKLDFWRKKNIKNYFFAFLHWL